MPVSLAVVSYPVRDLARARAFYEALFETMATSENVVDARFDLEGVCFHLFVDLRAEPPQREGVLLTWRVPDLDRAVAAAERLGGRCVLRRAPGEHGSTTHTATITDPSGNYVALQLAE